jgi:hypothetical protein
MNPKLRFSNVHGLGNSRAVTAAQAGPRWAMRRFVVVHELVQTKKPAVGRKLHTLTQTPRQLGKLLRAEQKNYDYKNQDPISRPWGHKSDRMHISNKYKEHSQRLGENTFLEVNLQGLHDFELFGGNLVEARRIEA